MIVVIPVFVVAARTVDPGALDLGPGPAFNTDDLGGGWQVFQADSPRPSTAIRPFVVVRVVFGSGPGRRG